MPMNLCRVRPCFSMSASALDPVLGTTYLLRRAELRAGRRRRPRVLQVIRRRTGAMVITILARRRQRAGNPEPTSGVHRGARSDERYVHELWHLPQPSWPRSSSRCGPLDRTVSSMASPRWFTSSSSTMTGARKAMAKSEFNSALLRSTKQKKSERPSISKLWTIRPVFASMNRTPPLP